MSSIDIIPPTTSLPNVQIERETLVKLGMHPNQVGPLLAAATCIVHPIMHGNAVLSRGLRVPPRTASIDLFQLSMVLNSVDMSNEVHKYAKLSFSPELQRQCREIISTFRLYWFTPSTVRFLAERIELNGEDAHAVIVALVQLSEATRMPQTPLFYEISAEIGTPVRHWYDNDHKVALNQYQLQRILEATPPVEILSNRVREHLIALLEEVRKLT